MNPRDLIGTTWRELRGSRRLQLALLAFVVIAAAEGGLRWSDRLAARERQLQDLRGELRSLRAQSRDEAELRQALAGLAEARRELDARLWRVPSEAIGQARLKDWLGGIAKQAGVANPTLTLSPPSRCWPPTRLPPPNWAPCTNCAPSSATPSRRTPSNGPWRPSKAARRSPPSRRSMPAGAIAASK